MFRESVYPDIPERIRFYRCVRPVAGPQDAGDIQEQSEGTADVAAPDEIPSDESKPYIEVRICSREDTE